MFLVYLIFFLSIIRQKSFYRDKLYSIQVTNAFSAVLSVARVEEILGDDQTVSGDDQSVGGDDRAPSPKPVDDRKDETRVTIPRVQCQHDKDGVCSLHGMGAKEIWKPAPTVTRGADRSLMRKKG